VIDAFENLVLAEMSISCGQTRDSDNPLLCEYMIENARPSKLKFSCLVDDAGNAGYCGSSLDFGKYVSRLMEDNEGDDDVDCTKTPDDVACILRRKNRQ
jgi:hypothetical protein